MKVGPVLVKNCVRNLRSCILFAKPMKKDLTLFSLRNNHNHNNNHNPRPNLKASHTGVFVDELFVTNSINSTNSTNSIDANGNQGIKYKLAFDGSVTRKSPTTNLHHCAQNILISSRNSNGPQCLSTY